MKEFRRGPSRDMHRNIGIIITLAFICFILFTVYLIIHTQDKKSMENEYAKTFVRVGERFEPSPLIDIIEMTEDGMIFEVADYKVTVKNDTIIGVKSMGFFERIIK